LALIEIQLFCSATLRKRFHQSPTSKTSSSSVPVVMKSVVVLSMVALPALVTYRMVEMLGRLRLSSRSRLGSRFLPIGFLSTAWKDGLGGGGLKHTAFRKGFMQMKNNLLFFDAYLRLSLGPHRPGNVDIGYQKCQSLA
jgi:hypothetical protein